MQTASCLPDHDEQQAANDHPSENQRPSKQPRLADPKDAARGAASRFAVTPKTSPKLPLTLDDDLDDATWINDVFMKTRVEMESTKKRSEEKRREIAAAAAAANDPIDAACAAAQEQSEAELRKLVAANSTKMARQACITCLHLTDKGVSLVSSISLLLLGKKDVAIRNKQLGVQLDAANRRAAGLEAQRGHEKARAAEERREELRHIAREQARQGEREGELRAATLEAASRLKERIAEGARESEGWSAARAGLERELRARDGELAVMRVESADLSKRLKAREGELKEAQEAARAADRKRADLARKEEGRRAGLERDLLAKEGELKGARVESADLSERLKTKEEELAGVRVESGDLSKKLKAREGELVGVQVESADLSQRLKTRVGELVGVRLERADLTKRLKAKEGELAGVQVESADLSKRLKAREGELKEARDSVVAMEGKAAAAEEGRRLSEEAQAALGTQLKLEKEKVAGMERARAAAATAAHSRASVKCPKPSLLSAGAKPLKDLEEEASKYFLTRENDTVRNIAQWCGIDKQALINLNLKKYPGLTAGAKLRKGTSLVLPSDVTGETMAVTKYAHCVISEQEFWDQLAGP